MAAIIMLGAGVICFTIGSIPGALIRGARKQAFHTSGNLIEHSEEQEE